MGFGIQVARIDPEFGLCSSSDPKELRQQALDDLEEINGIGLGQRALEAFTHRFPSGMVKRWSIGYIIDKDNIWCDFHFTLGDDAEIRHTEFGFRRTGDGTWEEQWNDGSETYELDSKFTKKLGRFEVRDGVLVVSDPSYDLDDVRRGSGVEILNAKKGDWNAQITISEFRQPRLALVSSLTVFHSSIRDFQELSWAFEGCVGVDRGMMGIYDFSAFHDRDRVPLETEWTFGESKDQPADPGELWYSLCCELCLHHQSGILDGGVVTRSGKGDGNYEYSIARNNDGSVVGIQLVFVDDSGRG